MCIIEDINPDVTRLDVDALNILISRESVTPRPPRLAAPKKNTFVCDNLHTHTHYIYII